MPGDFFNAPIMATDKGGLTLAKQIMKTLLSVAPVVCIQGTMSHDNDGAYSIFEDIPGFTLLKPGKVYALHRCENPFIGEIATSINIRHTIEDVKCILFGMPEITKQNIQSQLNLTAEEANGKAEELFKQYIENFVAPMRLKYKDVPAIGLLHGNVTDTVHKENELDNILKRSDILISTEVL